MNGSILIDGPVRAEHIVTESTVGGDGGVVIISSTVIIGEFGLSRTIVYKVTSVIGSRSIELSSSVFPTSISISGI